MTKHRFGFQRRKASEVKIGNVMIGGAHPVAVQSMTNTPTMDTEASAAQILRIAEAGADIVRLTAQTTAHARNLGDIRRAVRAAGCNVPLVADIHFNPAAAFAAAEEVEKVRINPGNFVDPGRTFVKLEFTDEEYAAEIQRIRDKFVPFLQLCRKNSVAIRIGVNHGSLSDRIMSRYGDTPAGMVESAMEFLRICVDEKFTDVVISIKASNVVVMTQTVRMLVEQMEREGMAFPLHLGVTEAGDGEDARVKSAVGIGSLLVDGIGDTIRVSLAEDPECEIPVAREIMRHIASLPKADGTVVDIDFEPYKGIPYVLGLDKDIPADAVIVKAVYPSVIESALAQAKHGDSLYVNAVYPDDMTPEQLQIAASIDLGYLLLNYNIAGIGIEASAMSRESLNSLALNILQATRKRISKTEYIACPSCGRTLFDLQTTLAKVKEATTALKGLKIGVMGCIVNGPGEMADADYGYVGAGPGRVSIYRGKECVEKNISADEALPRLIQLIKNDGRWPSEDENTAD